MTRAVTIAELGDQNVFTVDGNNNRIGIGTTNPQALLQVGTGVSVYGNSGIVSAKTYYGSGAELTGITGGATLSAASGNQRVVVTSLTSGSMTAAGTNADLAYNTTTNTLSATNISVSGTLTYEDVTNVDSLGIVTARTGIKVTAGGIDVVGGGLTVTGVSTFSDGINVVGGGLTVTGISTFPDDVTFIGASANITFDKSADSLLFADDAEAKFGDSGDLKIYHDGANSYVSDVGTGDLRLSGSFVKLNNVGNTATMVKATDGGSVELNHNGSKKFETTGAGVTVTGICSASGGVQVGSGQSFGDNGGTAVYYGDGSNLTGIAAGITTTKYSPTANAIIQIGLGTAQHHELTLTAGFTTITTSGGSFGESHSLVLIQPSSGIATVGFSTFFQFPSGSTPSMSEGSSKVDLVSFVVKDIAGNTGTGATELLASAGLNYS